MIFQFVKPMKARLDRYFKGQNNKTFQLDIIFNNGIINNR